MGVWVGVDLGCFILDHFSVKLIFWDVKMLMDPDWVYVGVSHVMRGANTTIVISLDRFDVEQSM